MTKPIILKKSSDNEQVVKVLEKVLSEALSGRISSVAIILCEPNGFAVETAGFQAEYLYMGAGSLQKKILEVVERRMPVIGMKGKQ